MYKEVSRTFETPEGTEVEVRLLVEEWFEKHPYGMGTASERMMDVVETKIEVDGTAISLEEAERRFTEETIEWWTEQILQDL